MTDPLSRRGPRVVMLCRTGHDARIWGDFGNAVARIADVVTPDPDDTPLVRRPEGGLRRTSGWRLDEVMGQVDTADVIVADADAVTTAVQLANECLSAALVLVNPRPDAPIGVSSTPWWSRPGDLVELVAAARVGVPALLAAIRDKAEGRSGKGHLEPLTDHLYGRYLHPDALELFKRIERAHETSGSIPATASSTVPWIDTIRDIQNPVRVLCPAHDADRVRTCTAVAARAAHGAVIPLDAYTDVPWLEDAEGAITAVTDLLPTPRE